MNIKKYFLVMHDGYSNQIIPLDGTFVFNDISWVDLYTLSYTKEEFLSHLSVTGVDFKDKDFFIARVDSKGKVMVYDCMFRINKDVPFYQRINNGMKQFALERNVKVQNHTQIALDKSPQFLDYTKMLINNITSNTNKKFVVSSSDTLKPEELKLRIQSIHTSKDFAKTLPKIQSFLVHYKTLRGLTLECLNYSFSDILSKDNEYRRNVVYQDFVLQRKIHMEEETGIRWNR